MRFIVIFLLTNNIKCIIISLCSCFIDVRGLMNVNKIKVNSIEHHLEKPRIKRPPTHLDHLPAVKLHLGDMGLLDLAVQRQNYTSVYVVSSQSSGQRTHNIRQSADLDKRRGLRGREKYTYRTHTIAPLPMTTG